MTDRSGVSLAAPDFQSLFEALPAQYLVLTPDFSIVAVSDAYLHATMTERVEILGRDLFDVFPDKPGDLAATNMRNLRLSLERVLQQRQADSMAVQQYAIRRPASEGGGVEERYWRPINSPILGPDHAVRYLVHRVEDVTEFIRLKQKGTEQDQTAQDMMSLATDLSVHKTTLEQMLLELQESNQQLRLQAEALASSNRYKSEFLANVSHELRTPLNCIMILSEQLRRNSTGNLSAKQLNYSEVISKAGADLLTLIDEVLDLAKIESGHTRVSNRWFRLSDLREQLECSLGPIAERKHLPLTLSLQPDLPPQLHSDQLRIYQILRNLIDNAIKFTEHGTVQVQFDRFDPAIDSLPPDVALTPASTLVVRVTDTGIGIAPDHHERIFHAFQQADSSSTRQFGGTGLGLTIARQLAALLGGDINLQSRLGSGSTFSLLLPITSAPAQTTAQNPRPHQVTDAAIATQALSTAAQYKKPTRVLLVDDDARNLLALSCLLEDLGYDVITAEHGAAALQILELHPDIDLVLMDMMMPVLDGYETTRILKHERACRIPIIALTARAMSGDRERCLAAGLDGYLSKPIATEKLIATIKECLAQSEAG